ncbi:hypothetical protein AN958_06402 [Leucoagaricus sp. SymC.cos]|nr:hypothetical protein AN958_06402 [Leucoagaricus sp. SymC.cos]
MLNPGCQKALIASAAFSVHAISIAVALYASSSYWKQDYHTSKLTRAEWVEKLIYGHPDYIWTELGVQLHVFLILEHELHTVCMIQDSQHVGVKEQLAIFLYMCVTGMSVCHVGERFQRSNETISKYFQLILSVFSSLSFYSKYVQLPRVDDPTPEFIQSQCKFAQFFGGAIGAMDGTHINCCPLAVDHAAAQNQKDGVSQNCLACISFSMRFLYLVSGWEGSTADATMYLQS